MALQHLMPILENKKIVLASGSASRKEAVKKNLGLDVILCPSTFEENLKVEDFNKFSDFVEETALQKVLEVEQRLKNEKRPYDVIIGADTMVAIDGQLLGKPDGDDYDNKAYQMLSSLSGKANEVYTGVVIKTKDQLVKFTEVTKVYFANLTEEQIRGYVHSGEPRGKAGSYAIQELGASLIEKIEGSFHNVLGLPVYKIAKELMNLYQN